MQKHQKNIVQTVSGDKMLKYIHLLVGAALIAAGLEYIDMTFTLYGVGVLFITAGIGEILIGE